MAGQAVPFYHVWFSTKRRKWLLQGDIADLVERAFRDIAEQDGIRVIECRCVIDHAHLLLDVGSSDELPSVMKALKGKSAYRVFRAAPDLKLDAKTDHPWQKGYGSKVVEPGAVPTVRRYIRAQMDRLEKFVR